MSNSRDVSPTQYQYDITMWFITSITSIQPAFIQSAFIQPAFIQSAFIQSAFIQSAFIQSAFYCKKVDAVNSVRTKIYFDDIILDTIFIVKDFVYPIMINLFKDNIQDHY
ncbi:hypothetical protein RhiirA5_411702 [Rhizophagus irregularis]|uniref:Uncharacterized protein n=1 Tax=Rhizophagus irregularis TaxID=588596 RepID=A0A2I1EFQ1_9GLOM|nr:hypothetical protein RhiirA5_411702 [Rhizophagus irregularis]PKC70921.1 hypothetical protein RhiirA1_454161 [Rhizophagus irregularis]PKY20941.1 hypothetical protein RhiirB3_434396 [Rhizophagus irregularis]